MRFHNLFMVFQGYFKGNILYSWTVDYNAKMEKGQEAMKFLMKRERPEEEKGKGRKKTVIILSAAGTCIVAASAAVFLFARPEKDVRHTDMPPAVNSLGEGIISASGLTEVGMLDETWELDFLQTALYVEESYLSMGDEVEEGTAVFKVSDETLKEARKELENAVTETELAYRQGILDYEAGAIDARVANENAAVDRKYSQAQYDKASAEAGKTVKELEKQAEEVRDLVDEYTKSVNEDYYRAYYKIDELYQAYYEHFSLLMETYEKWDIEDKESLFGNSVSSLGGGITGGVSGGGTMGGIPESGSLGDSSENSPMDGGFQPAELSEGEAVNTSATEEGPGQEGAMPDKAVGGGYSESETLLSVYNLLDEMVKQEGEEYKTALENYETAKRTAQAGLEKARSDLASLEAELVTARTEYEKQLIACKSDYEITLAESDNAQAVYEVTLESLEETLTSLESEKEEAADNLALFEEVIGDGYFYTSSAGTIVMNAIRQDSYLSGESLIIAYSNPEKVSVSANVDQRDIAGISIGDNVYAVISGYGNHQGKVTMMNPVTQAQSRSSVSYQVTVALEGDVSALDSNLTAFVYFGMSDEMMQEMQNMPQEMTNMPQDGGGNQEGDGGNIPEGGNMPQPGSNTFPGNRRKEDGQ